VVSCKPCGKLSASEVKVKCKSRSKPMHKWQVGEHVASQLARNKSIGKLMSKSTEMRQIAMLIGK